MDFDADAFISYAHLDNVELAAGHPGWVTNLQRALAIRLAQLLGTDSRVWWDQKLRGNDLLDATFVERLRHVAALVAVISPRYIKSEWCRKEITEFCKAAEAQGGVRVHEHIRLFKVLKTVVPLDQHPPELQSVVGYEFYRVEAATGRVRELDEIFGPEAERDFWIKLDDLAHDLCTLLESVAENDKTGGTGNGTPARGAIYLAETTSDLKDSRDAIKRDLEQHGYIVLPNNPLPVAAGDVETQVREALARCRLSIHLVGKTYSLVPEGGTSSLIEMQNELAIARSAAGGFSRLVWIPPGLRVDDDRQKKVLDNLRMDPRTERAADVLETPLQDLRTLITAWLKPEVPSAPAPGAQTPAGSTLPQVYLIYDQRDIAQMSVWSDFLFKQGCEVLRPVFDGDETDIREYHEENLRTSDGIVIFYGSGNELWLRRKLREVQKSAGYGRTKPNPAMVICLVAPKTPEKEQFNTHEATLVAQWDGLTAEAWQPFLSRLKGGEPRLSDDAAKPA